MADAPHLDAAAIRTLVEEVVRRVLSGDASGTSPLRPEEGDPRRAAEAARIAGTPYPLPSGAGACATLSDAVVTLAHVERLPAGTRSIAVSARAVITPSARDRARDAGITIVRGATAASGSAFPARPFVIGQADCRGGAAGPVAAVVHAVPHAQRLPASGLAEVIAALADHVSRDAARGLLLTSRPAAALVLTNRSPGLRAVTAPDPVGLAAAIAETAANLLVIDPAAFRGNLDRACALFVARSSDPVPAELAAPSAGCACQGHPH